MMTYPHQWGAQNVLFVQNPSVFALTRRSYDAFLFQRICNKFAWILLYNINWDMIKTDKVCDDALHNVSSLHASLQFLCFNNNIILSEGMALVKCIYPPPPQCLRLLSVLRRWFCCC